MVAHTSDLSTREAKAGDSKSEASIDYLVRPYVKKKIVFLYENTVRGSAGNQSQTFV